MRKIYMRMFEKMQLTSTELPDGRYYETYDNETERNRRHQELKNMWRKPEMWGYKSVNWMVYFVIYK